MIMYRITLLLLCAVVGLMLFSCSKSTSIGNYEQENGLSIGKLHNSVLYAIDQTKNPQELYNEEGLVALYDIVTLFNTISEVLIEMGYDSATCELITPLALQEMGNMSLMKDYNGSLFFDIRDCDFPLVTWDYLTVNGKLDSGTIEKLAPLFDIYREKGECEEMSVAVNNVTNDLYGYSPETAAKVFQFKDVFQESEEFWALYGMSAATADALGAFIGAVAGGAATTPAGGVGAVIVGTGLSVGWSKLHARFLAWQQNRH